MIRGLAASNPKKSALPHHVSVISSLDRDDPQRGSQRVRRIHKRHEGECSVTIVEPFLVGGGGTGLSVTFCPWAAPI